MNPTIKRVLIFLISFIAVLIFVLPFASVFVGTDVDKGEWRQVYLVNDWASLMFYLPFVILWLIFLIKKRALDFRIFKFLLGLTAFFTFYASAQSVIGGQDYMPGWGVFSSVFLFPLVLGFIFSKKQTTLKVNNY